MWVIWESTPLVILGVMFVDDSGNGTERWPSERDLFEQCEAHSMASVQSAERSVDNIVQRRSRISSQENGKYPSLYS